MTDYECKCEIINWVKYNEKEHILKQCKSCYCKWIREEITYDEYEKYCKLSPKNCGRKFKEICMVST